MAVVVAYMSKKVYLYDSEAEEIIGEGKQSDDGHIVLPISSIRELGDFIIIEADTFYEHDAVQEVVPKGVQGTQVHVECMKCGFETVYGGQRLINGSRRITNRDDGDEYPKQSNSCRECGANVWKEVEWQSGTCDWSESFEWAEEPS